jgi:WD40 repeat protein/serine/threonine protein kinase
MIQSGSERDPLELLAEEFAERYRRGEHPTLSEYTDKHPQLAQQIRDLFPAMVIMEDFGSTPGRSDAPFAGEVGGDRRMPAKLGEYRLLREVGRGGMGFVYEAVQETLGRHVALKLLPFHTMVSPTHLERFRREARAAARLHHTNIVPVFGVGEDQGVYYYAMQFIQGQGLDAVLAELRKRKCGQPASAGESDPTPSGLVQSIARGFQTGQFRTGDEANAASPPTLSAEIGKQDADSDVYLMLADSDGARRSSVGYSELTSTSEFQYFHSVARVGVQIAEALDYAHGQGILHRDIKPSNCLLDTTGRVWVTDFGLAKSEESDDLTRTGDIIGTLRYMAPERFAGRCDVQSEVYSLGLTLYELVTQTPAFADTDRARLIERVTHEEPPRPRRIDRHIPKDLETIVLKAIAKEPAARYATAQAVGQDLRRFLAGEPIQARRVKAWERAAKWARRRPALAALSGFAVLATAALVGSGIIYSLRLDRYNRLLKDALAAAQEQRDHADEQRRLAQQQELNARRHLYAASMNLAQQAWERGHTTRVVELLDAQRPQTGAEDLRSFEWYFLWGLYHRERLVLRGSAEAVPLAAFSRDERTLITTTPEGAYAWDVTTGRRLPFLDKSAAEGILTVAFSPDGRTLAGGSADGKISVWDWPDATLRAAFKAHADRVLALAYSPSGEIVASGDEQGIVRLWDVATKCEKAKLVGHKAAVGYLSFAPDGKLLASVSGDRTGRLWELSTGKSRILRGKQDAWISCLAFSPDGKYLARAEGHPFNALKAGSVSLEDLANGNEKASWDVPMGGAWVLTFAPNGKSLAWGENSGDVVLMNIANGQMRTKLRGHTNRPVSLAYSGDGRLLASGAIDGMVRLWSSELSDEPRILGEHEDPISAVTWAPDGRTLAAAVRAHSIKVWDAASGAQKAVLSGHTANVLALAFSPDGHWLATGSADATIKLWATDTWKEEATLKGHSGTVSSLAYSPDSATLASGSWDRTVKLWDCRQRCELFTLTGHTKFIASVAFAPDGKTLASGGADDLIMLWDISRGEPRTSLHARPLGGIYRLAFSPDGSRLAAASHNGVTTIWDISSESECVVLPNRADSRSLIAFSPDSKTLAAIASGTEVKFWDMTTFQERFTLKAHSRPVTGMAFSPDWQALATTSEDGTLKLWHAPR